MLKRPSPKYFRSAHRPKKQIPDLSGFNYDICKKVKTKRVSNDYFQYYR